MRAGPEGSYVGRRGVRLQERVRGIRDPVDAPGERNANRDGLIDFRRPRPRRSSPSGPDDPGPGDALRVRHYAQGKFYTIECPEGTRVILRSEQPQGGESVPHDHLVVPLDGKEIRIPADPPELLPALSVGRMT
jgi:hypothetical protein